MTDITVAELEALIVATADIHVRPPLPVGIRYAHPTDDRITITDIGDIDPPRFVGIDDYNCGFIFLEPGYRATTVGRGYTGIRDMTWQSATVRLHLVLTPVGTDPNISRSHPAYFASSKDNPWEAFQFWTDHFVRHVEHMVAPSSKHPGLLMYYQSVEKRIRDIRTPIKPGKYLTKYFSDVLTGEEINNLAVMWSNMAQPPVLRVTQDADEIERVYRGRLQR